MVNRLEFEPPLPQFRKGQGKVYLSAWFGDFEIVGERFESTRDGTSLEVTLDLIPTKIPEPPTPPFNTVDLISLCDRVRGVVTYPRSPA